MHWNIHKKKTPKYLTANIKCFFNEQYLFCSGSKENRTSPSVGCPLVPSPLSPFTHFTKIISLRVKLASSLAPGFPPLPHLLLKPTHKNPPHKQASTPAGFSSFRTNQSVLQARLTGWVSVRVSGSPSVLGSWLTWDGLPRTPPFSLTIAWLCSAVFVLQVGRCRRGWPSSPQRVQIWLRREQLQQRLVHSVFVQLRHRKAPFDNSLFYIPHFYFNLRWCPFEYEQLNYAFQDLAVGKLDVWRHWSSQEEAGVKQFRQECIITQGQLKWIGCKQTPVATVTQMKVSFFSFCLKSQLAQRHPRWQSVWTGSQRDPGNSNTSLPSILWRNIVHFDQKEKLHLKYWFG